MENIDNGKNNKPKKHRVARAVVWFIGEAFQEIVEAGIKALIHIF